MWSVGLDRSVLPCQAHGPIGSTPPGSIMRKLLFLGIALASVAVGHTAPGDAAAPASFSSFFKPGAALQDRNGDGVVDFVDARIVLAERPSTAEVAAAAAVAARL